jgi:Zn-dependent peptidase ImmA (M78 family)
MAHARIAARAAKQIERAPCLAARDEREANLFAAELLMPAKFLQKDLSGQNLDLLEDEGVLLHKLARKYKVSTQALSFRLANLGHIKL